MESSVDDVRFVFNINPFENPVPTLVFFLTKASFSKSFFFSIPISINFCLVIFFVIFSRSLIECHIDAGRKDDASQVASTAAQFTKTNVPSLYKDVLGLQVNVFIFNDLKHFIKNAFNIT